jgi:hypothetical protein
MVCGKIANHPKATDVPNRRKSKITVSPVKNRNLKNGPTESQHSRYSQWSFNEHPLGNPVLIQTALLQDRRALDVASSTARTGSHFVTCT